MTSKKPKILIFTENFEKRFLAQNIINVKKLESFLNNSKDKNEIILEEVSSCYKKGKGIWVPKDHERDYQSINTNYIDFIFGPEELIYSKNHLTLDKEVSVLWGMKGLHHDLIGDIKSPGTYKPPRFNQNDSEPEKKKKGRELIIYLSKQLKRNFIPFYNPRTDSPDAKKEFEDLFRGTGIKMSEINKVLLNNRKQSRSATSRTIYRGKNFNKN